MRLALTFALVLAAATSRQGCGSGTSYEACAGKSCGDACTVCAPDDHNCVETAVVKACDPFHRCVPLVDGLCAAVQGACARKACGEDCTIDPPCRSATPPCMLPSMLGHCDPSGTCIAEAPPLCPPSWGCVGKACGDSCGFCPQGEDPANCPVPTLAATACDAALQCVTAGTFYCSPEAACLGKACGAACDTCGGACMRPYAMYCDASGSCVPGTVTCTP
jgi:hypothetical protein